MIRCHLEWGEHQNRLLHLLDAEARDAKHLTLVGHFVRQKLNVPVVDLNTVLTNRELDLLNDRISCSFDSKNFGCLHDMISRGEAVIYSWCSHHSSQTIALYSQVILLFRCISWNDCPLDGWASLNNHVGQFTLQTLHHEVQLVTWCLIRLDVHLVVSDNFKVLLFYFKLASAKNALADWLNWDFKL